MPQHSLTVACSMARGQAPRGVPSRLYGRPGGRHLEIGALPGSSWEEGVLKDTASTRRGWRERGVYPAEPALAALIAAGTWLRCGFCGPQPWLVR